MCRGEYVVGTDVWGPDTMQTLLVFLVLKYMAFWQPCHKDSLGVTSLMELTRTELSPFTLRKGQAEVQRRRPARLQADYHFLQNGILKGDKGLAYCRAFKTSSEV